MAMRLLDTNIVSFIMNGHSLAVAYQPHLAGDGLAVSFQTLAELLAAAGALAFDLELVTHNPADFQSIPGLTIITEAP